VGSFRDNGIQEIPSFQDVLSEFFFCCVGTEGLMGAADIVTNEFEDNELWVIVGLVSTNSLEIM